MRTNFSQAAKIFFNPETLVPFLVGAIFLSVLGNSITQVLYNSFGTSTTSVLKIALGAVCIFVLSVLLFAKGLSRLNSPEVKLDKLPPVKHRGLILLVSKLEPCQKAIEYHQPVLERCWLICSTQSLELAQQLQRDYLKLKISDPIVINDVYDPLEFYKCVKKIYASLPKDWTGQDIIADFTGMTAHASVGMVLASLSPQYQLEYTPAESNKDGKLTGRSLDPIEIVLKPQPRNVDSEPSKAETAIAKL